MRPEPLVTLTFHGSRNPDTGEVVTTGCTVRSKVIGYDDAVALVPQLLALTVLHGTADDIVNLSGIEGL